MFSYFSQHDFKNILLEICNFFSRKDIYKLVPKINIDKIFLGILGLYFHFASSRGSCLDHDPKEQCFYFVKCHEI